jgi:hypothetical protein
VIDAATGLNNKLTVYVTTGGFDLNRPKYSDGVHIFADVKNFAEVWTRFSLTEGLVIKSEEVTLMGNSSLAF